MISTLMEYTNYLGKIKDNGTFSLKDWQEAIKTLLLLLAPSAPHLAEELWQQLGYTYSIHNQKWPEWNEELAQDEEIPIIIQINGKTRDKVTVPASITEEEARKSFLPNRRLRRILKGKRYNQE
jgi:leucyl-tRNA synthetase